MSLQTPSDNWWKGGQYFECIWQTKIIHLLQMSDSLFNPSSKGCNVYMSVIKNGVGLTTTNGIPPQYSRDKLHESQNVMN